MPAYALLVLAFVLLYGVFRRLAALEELAATDHSRPLTVQLSVDGDTVIDALRRAGKVRACETTQAAPRSWWPWPYPRKYGGVILDRLTR